MCKIKKMLCFSWSFILPKACYNKAGWDQKVNSSTPDEATKPQSTPLFQSCFSRTQRKPQHIHMHQIIQKNTEKNARLMETYSAFNLLLTLKSAVKSVSQPLSCWSRAVYSHSVVIQKKCNSSVSYHVLLCRYSQSFLKWKCTLLY